MKEAHMPKSEALVRLYPTRDASIPGVAAEVIDVTPERAAELLEYQPQAFTTDPPPPPIPDPPADGV
jgi:hypothetical protein